MRDALVHAPARMLLPRALTPALHTPIRPCADDGAPLSGRGVRVAVGGSSFDIVGDSLGGLAYPGSWGDAAYDPALVFPQQLGDVTKSVAEAISHEVGGLRGGIGRTWR